MSFKPKIKIKNFGAIKATNPDGDGWLEINKVTVFIGDQGSGKSTIAKLISTFMWIEQALVRGDYNKKFFQRKGKFVNYLKYHRLEHYLQEDSYIEYKGIGRNIIFKKKENKLEIEEPIRGDYILPKIMYVPAERNFIAYVKSARELKISSESMQEFLTEFNNAKKTIKQSFKLPIDNVNLEYDRLNDRLNLKGQDYKIRLSDSASGFQSTVPLLLVSNYLAQSVQNPNGSNAPMSEKERENFSKEMQQILGNTDLTEEQRRLAISLISARFNKKAFINIVEEPEQNLFPNSQWEILKELLKLNNQNKHNQLILTTHSPYIINYLSIAIKAQQTYEKLLDIAQENLANELNGLFDHDRLLPAEIPTEADLEEIVFSKVNEIVPIESHTDGQYVSVYQLKNGTINLLSEIDGMPSDDNYLNHALEDGNELICQLFELERDFIDESFLQ